MGRYGCNCSQVCSTGTYGLNCYHQCYCTGDEVCDPAVGCTNVTTTLSPTTLSQSTARIYNSTSMNSGNIYSYIMACDSSSIVYPMFTKEEIDKKSRKSSQNHITCVKATSNIDSCFWGFSLFIKSWRMNDE